MKRSIWILIALIVILALLYYLNWKQNRNISVINTWDTKSTWELLSGDLNWSIVSGESETDSLIKNILSWKVNSGISNETYLKIKKLIEERKKSITTGNRLTEEDVSLIEKVLKELQNVK